jgi:hypothetical protein
MLNPFEAVVALQKLVLLHHKPWASDELSPFIVCFDEAGTELDPTHVSADHPTEMVGHLETWTPKPGTSYYAHLRQSSSSANRHSGALTRWEVEGPDWAAFVDVYEPINGSISVSVNIPSVTAEVLSFLEHYRTT